MYAIQNTENQKYLEQDFGGWSWQDDPRLIFKFRSKEEAEEYASAMVSTGQPCEVVDYPTQNATTDNH